MKSWQEEEIERICSGNVVEFAKCTNHVAGSRIGISWTVRPIRSILIGATAGASKDVLGRCGFVLYHHHDKLLWLT